MLISARVRNIEDFRKILEELKITSGSICTSCVGSKFIEKFTYVRSTDNISEVLIPDLNFAKNNCEELCITISDSYSMCRSCIDSVLCLTFKGIVSFINIYNIILQKNLEITEPKPEIALIELLSTIYQTDGDFVVEKSLEILTDELIKNNVIVDHLVLSVSQIRDCCANMYIIAVSKSRDVSLYTRVENRNLVAVYVEPEIEEYPYISSILSKFRKIKVHRNTMLIMRFGKEEFWQLQKAIG